MRFASSATKSRSMVRRLPGVEFKTQRRNPCHLLWRGPLYVRYDGLAYPCCYMYDEPPGRRSEEAVRHGSLELRRDGQAARSAPQGRPFSVSSLPDLPGRASKSRAFYGSLALNSLTVRKAVPAMEKLARFYNIGVFEEA